MAFDRPLEADRVDDLGLLSSFVRAPILGPVMWILGKKLLPDEKPDKTSNDAHKLIDECAVNNSTGSDDVTNAFTLKNSNEKYPDLASSTISDIVNDSSIDEMDYSNSSLHMRRKFVINNEESKVNDSSSHPLQAIKRRNRRMSWSDESGQSLVEYCDLVSSIHPSCLAGDACMSDVCKRYSKAMKATWPLGRCDLYFCPARLHSLVRSATFNVYTSAKFVFVPV